MGYLYPLKLESGKRSRVWWAQYYVNGPRCGEHEEREGTGGPTVSEAPRGCRHDGRANPAPARPDPL